jgi:hypothetical protein
MLQRDEGRHFTSTDRQAFSSSLDEKRLKKCGRLPNELFSPNHAASYFGATPYFGASMFVTGSLNLSKRL